MKTCAPETLTQQHRITSQKTRILDKTAVKTSKLAVCLSISDSEMSYNF